MLGIKLQASNKMQVDRESQRRVEETNVSDKSCLTQVQPAKYLQVSILAPPLLRRFQFTAQLHTEGQNFDTIHILFNAVKTKD